MYGGWTHNSREPCGNELHCKDRSHHRPDVKFRRHGSLSSCLSTICICRGSTQGQPGAMQQTPMVLRCGAAVLQDMAVAVADAAADAYLAEAGVRKGGETALELGFYF